MSTAAWLHQFIQSCDIDGMIVFLLINSIKLK